MSRSDNTIPSRLRGQTSAEQHWRNWPLPRRTGRYLRRQWQKGQRQAEHRALARQEEPEPARPRHGVIYDYW